MLGDALPGGRGTGRFWRPTLDPVLWLCERCIQVGSRRSDFCRSDLGCFGSTGARGNPSRMPADCCTDWCCVRGRRGAGLCADSRDWNRWLGPSWLRRGQLPCYCL